MHQWSDSSDGAGERSYFLFGQGLTLFGLPAALLLGGMYYFGVDRDLWIPVLLVYAVAMFGGMMNFCLSALLSHANLISECWEALREAEKADQSSST